MIDIHTLARILKPNQLLLRFLATLKSIGSLLGYPDEQHPFFAFKLDAIFRRHIFLTSSFFKMDNLYPLRLGKPLHRLFVSISPLPQERWRGDLIAALLDEFNQLAPHLHRRDIAIQINSVNALYVQGHMLFQNFVDVCHRWFLSRPAYFNLHIQSIFAFAYLAV